MNAEITTFQVDGWTLSKLSSDDDEPVIAAEVLGEKLGFTEPRAIRRLIKRMAGSGKLPEVCVRGIVSRTQMPTGGVRETKVNEYFLTEAQALKVIAKSETEIADKILDEIIGVFVKVRKGLFAGQRQAFDMQALVSVVATTVATTVVATMGPMFEKLFGMMSAQRNDAASGTIGREGAAFIRAGLKLYAEWMSPDDKIGQKSWRVSAEHEIRGLVGFSGYGRKWPELPSSLFPQVRMKLEELQRRARKTHEMIEARHPRQSKLDLEGAMT